MFYMCATAIGRVADVRNAPVRCMNLRRRTDRRQNVLTLKGELGLQDFKIITAVDGQELLQSGGRMRKMTPRT